MGLRLALQTVMRYEEMAGVSTTDEMMVTLSMGMAATPPDTLSMGTLAQAEAGTPSMFAGKAVGMESPSTAQSTTSLMTTNAMMEIMSMETGVVPSAKLRKDGLVLAETKQPLLPAQKPVEMASGPMLLAMMRIPMMVMDEAAPVR